jgi:hypothetical protein
MAHRRRGGRFVIGTILFSRWGRGERVVGFDAGDEVEARHGMGHGELRRLAAADEGQGEGEYGE